MAKFDLDLKKFKHLKSDDKSTTLQHEAGHVLTIAHKSLSKDFQKQLSALSKLPKDDETPDQASEANQLRMADGGVTPPSESQEEADSGPPIQASPSSQSSGGGGGMSGIMKLIPLIAAAAQGGDVDAIKANAFRQYFGIPVEKAAAVLGMNVEQGADKIANAYTQYVQANPQQVNHNTQNQSNYVDPIAAPKQVPQLNAQDMQSYDSSLANQANYAATQKAKDSQIQADEVAHQEKMNKLEEPVDNSGYDTGYTTYADGGDVEADPNQVRSENPNYQPPQVPQADPQVEPTPYVKEYENSLRLSHKADPMNLFMKNDEMQEMALNEAERKKENDQADFTNMQEDQRQAQQKRISENTRRAAIGLPPLPVPSFPQVNIADQPPQANQPQAADQTPPAAPQVPQSAQPDQGMGVAPGRDPESMLAKGYQNKLAGINKAAQATGQLGEQQADALNQNIEAQNQARQAFQNSFSELDNERQAHMQDIKNGYIDPSAYWKDHSKLLAGIGMVLAGFNPTNSPNAAVNFIKYQMDQNMEAQRQNLAAKQNMLSANLHQFGNLRDATDMTRLMQNDIVSHSLQAAAAKAQTPMAKAAALQAAGQLQMESAPMFQNFAMRRAMMNLANSGGTPNSVDHLLGYMRVVNPEMAKEMESRYVPNVGLANVPVPGEVRSQMIAKQQFGEAVRDLQSWAVQHSGSLSPSAILEGRTKAANVQNLYRQGINGGVFKQGEQSFINGIVDAEPTKFFNSIRVIPKLNEVMKENDNSLNVLKRGYGLPQARQATQQAPQYKMVNGVKYMRGPNGEAVRVK